MKQQFYTYIIFFGLVIGTLSLFSQDKTIVKSVSFNTSGTEYAPMYFKNGLVFSGISTTNKALTYIDDKNGKQMTDLLFVPLGNAQNKKPNLFSKSLQTGYHDGAITFSGDGNTAYFTRTQTAVKKLKNNIKQKNVLGIFKATFNGSEWENITKCSFNTANFNYGHPSLSADGKRLYLVSNKDGGFGGKDIYYCEIKDGVCGELINLGETVNTSANEMFPFIDANNKLYFSSNRPSGYGGLDIYVSKLSNNKWNDPYLMDSSINSSFDDFSIVFNQDETEGYFSSNRSGSDDIYKLSVHYPDFGECEELINELLCYEFYEEATLNADSVAMIYEWDFGDGTKERSLETYHCFKKSGLYIVELNIMDPMVGQTFVNEATYELEIEEVIQPQVVCSDTISINNEFKVAVEQGKWIAYQVGNYYVDYGDSSGIVKNNVTAHYYKTDGFKELKILITGYDKSTGTMMSNCFYKTIFVTSDSTLITTKDVFIEELSYSGFNSDRIEEYEDGFYTLLIATSKTSIKNDTALLKGYTGKVNEVYHEKTKTYLYVTGKTDNPFDFIAQYRTAHKAGFSEAVVKSFEEGSIAIEDLGLTFDNASGEVNIALKNIQFKYDGYLLDEESKKELKKLVKFLKLNEDIKIEIGAHTDASRDVEKAKKIFEARGQSYTKEAHDKMSGGYNLKLSQKRAKSVVEYLHKEGVGINRLEAKGYGEKQPVAPNYLKNGKDNSVGQTKNRRVVFKVISK
jgi:outer membrane protein OmpA-like peptidoglycan-associated protein